MGAHCGHLLALLWYVLVIQSFSHDLDTFLWAIWDGNQRLALPISVDSLFLDSCLLLTARLLGIMALSLVI